MTIPYDPGRFIGKAGPFLQAIDMGVGSPLFGCQREDGCSRTKKMGRPPVARAERPPTPSDHPVDASHRWWWVAATTSQCQVSG